MLGGAMARGRGGFLVALGAFALTVPVGYALADEIVGGEEPSGEAPARAVPASECPAGVNEAFERAGLPRDYYAPSCPTVAEAEEQASYFNEARRRGLTHIAESIETYGGSDDAEDLEAIEAELAPLGGRWHAEGGNGE